LTDTRYRRSEPVRAGSSPGDRRRSNVDKPPVAPNGPIAATSTARRNTPTLCRVAIKFKYSAQSSAPLVNAGTEEIGCFSEPSAWRIRFRTEIHKFTNSRAPTTGSVQGIQDYMPLDWPRFALGCRRTPPNPPLPRMPMNLRAGISRATLLQVAAS